MIHTKKMRKVQIEKEQSRSVLPMIDTIFFKKTFGFVHLFSKLICTSFKLQLFCQPSVQQNGTEEHSV